MERTVHFRFNARSELNKMARELRKRSTPAEKLLWQLLRNRRLKNFKFRRQAPLGYFIADFYCSEVKLVIELDGSIHDLKHVKEYDKERQEYLTSLGLTILRFTNDELFAETERVIGRIESYLDEWSKLSPFIAKKSHFLNLNTSN